MAAAGCHLHEDLTQLAVMWFLRALLNLPRFWQLVCTCRSLFSPSPSGRGRADRLSGLQLVDRPPREATQNSRCSTTGHRRCGLGPLGAFTRCGDWSIMCLCKLPFEADWYRAARVSRRRTSAIRTSTNLSSQQLDEPFLRWLQRATARWSRSCRGRGRRKSRRTWMLSCETASSFAIGVRGSIRDRRLQRPKPRWRRGGLLRISAHLAFMSAGHPN